MRMNEQNKQMYKKMEACHSGQVSLKDLQDHFDRAAYKKLLLSCADRFTDEKTLSDIYQRFFLGQSTTLDKMRTSGLEVDDLSQIMKYKLCRGKWRPRLQEMIASNGAKETKEITQSALANSRLTLEDKMKTLTQLKAVGPATASLILTIFDESVPFFSDEFAAFHLPKGEKPKYNMSEYKTLVSLNEAWIRSEAGEESSKPSAREVEEMVWYWIRSDRSSKIVDTKEDNLADSKNNKRTASTQAADELPSKKRKD